MIEVLAKVMMVTTEVTYNISVLHFPHLQSTHN